MGLRVKCVNNALNVNCLFVGVVAIQLAVNLSTPYTVVREENLQLGWCPFHTFHIGQIDNTAGQD
jgi:hypothetical protein